MKKEERLPLVFKGMAMGVAEVIPGVSGGTIAFITGIYERLLHSIKSFLGPGSVEALQKGGIKSFWAYIDGNFLVFLLMGMAAGVAGGVFGISHLLSHYPQLVWSFFFGLIVASAIYVARKVGKWSLYEVSALVISTAVAYIYTIAAPVEGIHSLWFVFLCGTIAISALMLPGVSGSFILVLLGMYATIINAVKLTLSTLDVDSLFTVLVFALGCLIGLATFSRILTWTFKHYHNPTMAALTGFMIGSLNKIWPWKQVISWRTDSHGQQVPLMDQSVWPSQVDDPMVLFCVVLAVTGFVLVLMLERFGKK